MVVSAERERGLVLVVGWRDKGRNDPKVHALGLYGSGMHSALVARSKCTGRKCKKCIGKTIVRDKTTSKKSNSPFSKTCSHFISSDKNIQMLDEPC